MALVTTPTTCLLLRVLLIAKRTSPPISLSAPIRVCCALDGCVAISPKRHFHPQKDAPYRAKRILVEDGALDDIGGEVTFGVEPAHRIG